MSFFVLLDCTLCQILFNGISCHDDDLSQASKPATPARFSQLYANFLQLIKSTFQMMKSSSVS